MCKKTVLISVNLCLIFLLLVCLPASASVELKQSTAVTVKVGPFTDITDGTTRETALTITQGSVYLSKNGGTLAAKNDSNALTHDALGVYGCKLDTTDTGTLGALRLDINDINAVPVWAECQVVDANYWNAKYAGTNLPVTLVATGLDNIPTTEPNGVADTFREMQVQMWRRFFKKTARTATKIYTYNDANVACTTQDWSDSGGVQIAGNSE